MHQSLEHGVAAAEWTRGPVQVVIEPISCNDVPHFDGELFKRNDRAQLCEIALPNNGQGQTKAR